jgi:hypothetical protein
MAVMFLVVVEQRARAGARQGANTRALAASGQRADGGAARGADPHPLHRFHVPFMTDVTRPRSASRLDSAAIGVRHGHARSRGAK